MVLLTRPLFLLIALVSLNTFAATQAEVLKSYQKLASLKATKTSLNKQERQTLFTEARHHKIASLDIVSKYDPTGDIGFCFGRAMTVHLLARKMGLGSENIRKLFVIGDLRSTPKPEWRFHVTTLVKGEDGLWYAVDPIMEFPVASGTPLKMERWISIVQRTWDKQSKAHFYLVDNDVIIPDVRTVPDLDKEKGEHIIEVSFDPEKEPGFQTEVLEGRTYFKVSSKNQVRYFTSVNESGMDQFPFLDIAINGEVLDFHGYFVDLMGNLLNE